MKLAKQNISVLMAVLVVATAGTTFTLNEAFDTVEPSSQTKGVAMTGNVKITQTDEAGNVIAYRQSENHIVKQGLEIIVGQVFNTMNETNAAGPGGFATHPISHIDIGSDGEWRLLHNDTGLRRAMIVDDVSCVRQPITVANVSAATTGSEQAPTSCVEPNCAAQYNVTATATFDGDDCDGGAITIDEAGIFDNVSDIMFARNNFGGVDLNAGDSLRLDWEFTFTDNIN